MLRIRQSEKSTTSIVAMLSSAAIAKAPRFSQISTSTHSLCRPRWLSDHQSLGHGLDPMRTCSERIQCLLHLSCFEPGAKAVAECRPPPLDSPSGLANSPDIPGIFKLPPVSPVPSPRSLCLIHIDTNLLLYCLIDLTYNAIQQVIVGSSVDPSRIARKVPRAVESQDRSQGRSQGLE